MTMLLPRMCLAMLLSPMPNTMLVREAAPTPMSTPKAALTFITGKVMASPAMASGPTP